MNSHLNDLAIAGIYLYTLSPEKTTRRRAYGSENKLNATFRVFCLALGVCLTRFPDLCQVAVFRNHEKKPLVK